MEDDIAKSYDPKIVEEKIYNLWLKSGFFNPDKLPKNRRGKTKTYSLLLPPPNITGSLHMGHALNAIIQDILIRWHRMAGYQTVWLPGTDHAGIATQNAVEKMLKKENINRWDLGREKFIQKVREWKEKFGNLILDQLKKLGASCDWSRTRFTLDPAYSQKVKKTFIKYWEKGLIYRGKRVVNWCPRCQTSLSDLEIEYKEEKTKLWYIKYPIIGNPKSEIRNSKQIPNSITVATTRPETMLGDAAIAVNPKDQRYKNLIGQKVILPLSASTKVSADGQNREIPIIADPLVDQDFGTGAVKVTPAHDLVDAEIGRKHNLPSYQIINEYGRMTEKTGSQFKDMKVLECRGTVIARLQELSLIEKTEDYNHNISICYRCGAAIEPILSNQWFIRMASPTQNQKSDMSLRDMAIKAVKSGEVKFIPKSFEKPYFAWLKNIKDWCVSRQIWWGHQLPVFFCKRKQEEIKNQKSKIINNKEDFIVSLEKPKKCPFCKNCEMEQSQDVLDTWFSSALWPFAGLPSKDLKRFYPSQVLVTARDIINLWVARMIFSGLEFIGKEPFPKVLIHATILTKEGKRMSKSLGTGVDPLELIGKFGADALRFGIIWQTMGSQDIHWDENAVIGGKKFANKIWNASRFVLMQNGKSEIRNPKSETNSKFPACAEPAYRTGRASADRQIPNSRKLTKADKLILTELEKTKKQIENNLKNYRFGQALHKIYDFFWHNFCDVYIEAAKKQLTTYNLQLATSKILFHILLESLKLLHPFMPFVTEEIYQTLPIKNKKFILIEKW